MAIDEVVAGGGVFVLADFGLEEGGIFDFGEALGEVTTDFFDSLFGNGAVFGVGIDDGAVGIDGDFEAAGFDVGNAVEAVGAIDPAGHGGGVPGAVARGGTEVEDFLAGGADDVGE